LKKLCVALFIALFAPRVYAISPAVALSGKNVPSPLFAPEIAILETGQRLSAQYGSRPPYNGPPFLKNEPLSPEQAAQVIPYLGACESRWRVIKEVDDNGFYSYGPLQIQSSTAALFNSLDHTSYNPMIPFQAIDLTEIALEHGYLDRWSCARLIGLIK
jgi:hypothetical protein